MPFTPKKIAPGMEVHIDNSHRCPIAGETLTGFVTYKPSKPEKYTQVTISIQGRAKTKLVKKSGNYSDVYRGRENLFSHSPSKVLYSGELKETNEDDVWPFSIDIPSKLSSSTTGSEQNLPPFFYLNPDERHSFSGVTKYHAFVEYILTVEITNKTKNKLVASTTLPLPIRPRAEAKPIKNWQLYTQQKLIEIKTMALLPNKPAKMGEKMRYLFKPSLIPKYAFVFLMEFPKRIQLDHPHALPFRIAIAEDAHTRSLTKLEVPTPPVKITSVTLRLECSTTIQGDGELFGSNDATKTTIYQLGGDTSRTGGGGGIVIPVVDLAASDTQDAGQRSLSYLRYTGQPATGIPKETCHDIGAILSINLSSTVSTSLTSKFSPRKFEMPLTPTFNTQFIRVSYYLHWSIWIECSGERVEIEGSTPCAILATSESVVKDKIQSATRAGLGLQENGIGFTELTGHMAEGMKMMYDTTKAMGGWIEVLFGG